MGAFRDLVAGRLLPEKFHFFSPASVQQPFKAQGCRVGFDRRTIPMQDSGLRIRDCELRGLGFKA